MHSRHWGIRYGDAKSEGGWGGGVLVLPMASLTEHLTQHCNHTSCYHSSNRLTLIHPEVK